MVRPAAIQSAVGLAILSAALLLAAGNLLRIQRSRSGIATYVDSVSRIGGNHGETFLHPRFVFRPGPERPLQKVVSTWGSTSDGYSAGDTVRVYYEAAHPERATLATFRDMWIGPTVLGMVGSFLLCPAALMLILAGRRRQAGS